MGQAIVGKTADAAEMDAKVLIVDDDDALAREIAAYLARAGYRVETAHDARMMEAALASDRFDLIILDVMMPGEDGLSICRRLSGTAAPPIIIMSAMGDDVDRIVGLELGADDYLAKPCNPRELQARVRAVLRRHAGSEAAGRRGSDYILRFAGYELDVASRRLRGPMGVTILLTRSEFMLLTALLERPGEVLSRDQLLDHTRSADAEAFDRVIDVQISRLRRKLGDRDGQEVIRTIRGAGYKLNAPVTRR